MPLFSINVRRQQMCGNAGTCLYDSFSRALHPDLYEFTLWSCDSDGWLQTYYFHYLQPNWNILDEFQEMARGSSLTFC